MTSLSFRANPHRRVILSLFMMSVLMVTLLAGTGRAKADDSTDPPTSGPVGSSFMFYGNSFTPQEKIVLWTTGPDGKVLDAGYIFADEDGNFSLKVDSADPKGLAVNGNYTTLTDEYDADGNVVNEYWETILKDNPAAGSWHVTGQGSTSKTSMTFDFTLTAQS